MVGATAAGAPGYTFRVAALLVALPAVLLTVTLKLPELSRVTPEGAAPDCWRRRVRAVAVPLITQRLGAARIHREHGIAAGCHAEVGGLRGDGRRHVEVADRNGDRGACGAAHRVGGDHAVLDAVVGKRSGRGGVVSGGRDRCPT